MTAGFGLRWLRDVKHRACSSHRSSRLLALFLALSVHPLTVRADGSCTGDIDCDDRVGVNGLISGVSSTLGTPRPATLLAFDRNGGGSIEIAELVAAVGNALPATDNPSLARTTRGIWR